MLDVRPLRYLPLLVAVALVGCDDDEVNQPLGAADLGPDAAEVDATPSDAQPDATDEGAGDATPEGCVAVDLPPAADDLPPSWVFGAAGIRVEVERDPLRWRVRDADGDAVLSSAVGGAPGAPDGYGAVGWTTGTIDWYRQSSEGYIGFDHTLAPWRDDWTVVAATPTGDGLALTLQGPDPTAEDCLPLRIELTFTARPSTVRVEMALADVDGAPVPRAWTAAFATPDDEAFVGFGERFNQLDQRGVDVYGWAEEGGVGTGEGDLAGPSNPFPNGEAMTNYPVPFFMSTEGYGFWLDSTWYHTFELATADPEHWRIWDIGPSMAFEVYVPIPEDARPWPHHLLDLFTATVGRAMVPPQWAFGPRRRIGASSMEGDVHVLQAMRDLDLAITTVDDAIHFLPAGSHVGREQARSDWIDFAASLGARVNGYYNSLISTAEDNPIRDVYLEGEENGYYVLGPDGEPAEVFLISGRPVFVTQVDFTHPDAVPWFQAMFDWALDLGYSGWMYDFGEYIQPHDTLFDGSTGEEHHNLYPVLYQKAAFDHLEAGPHAGDWLTFVRSGYTGAWQYSPFVWSGDPAASFEDSDGLPSMVRAGVNLGLSGAPHWGGDIGGFHCNADGGEAADGELLARWIQMGAMSSNMQDQDACAFGDRDLKATIFTSDDAFDAWYTYARLHTRMLPYLYALAHEATNTGAPTMRALWFEHPDRPALAGVDHTYYFGPSLLVAPVVDRGARTKDVPLPPGRFLFWDEERVIDGDTTVTVDAPLDRLPLFLRDGHLLPLLDPTIDTLKVEDVPDVVGPTDVDDVYDVVGFVSDATGGGSFTLWDGSMVVAELEGAPSVDALPAAEDAAALGDCDPCAWVDDLGDGLQRVRISASDRVEAGGLVLDAPGVERRIRWDLYVLTP